MIRLILTGGLGNQMFEYAAARSLSLRLNTALEIDLYAINKKTKGTKRELELSVFDLHLETNSSWKSRVLVKAFPIVEKNRKLFQKWFGYFRDHSAIVYSPLFASLSGNIILHGHFQNTRYFSEYEAEIRTEFKFREPLTGRNKEIAKQIQSSQSVSIHIRRGDYLTDAMAKNNFAVCDELYYQKAIAFIETKFGISHFYVFSDDIAWAKSHIQFGSNRVEFIDWNKDRESYRDMQLMSLCRHNIIANSSFSWWGAWLNANKSKTVIAPSQWFSEEIRNDDLSDFYPKNWTII